MAQLIKAGDAKDLQLPGRRSLEILSSKLGSDAVSLRLVEIPVPSPDTPPRKHHFHSNHEECIYILSGKGRTMADSWEYALRPGDTILIPPKEKHVTLNTGNDPLLMLCFFPTGCVSETKA